ncbi:unnamed protein product [Zymoseptoria tritici ST99CH_3D7]|uniref:F-box domain-containing protein n=1 Tax=Zymoseptoria tritici (strain ST99CH_3D7) TaxID=1276538 RepID=A0A1X7RJL6_ZYMT9|nr:unnamed protein product [Zymoseptoria tritici ST99CH_3D7]
MSAGTPMSFLDLPGELRNLVYDHIIDEVDPSQLIAIIRNAPPGTDHTNPLDLPGQLRNLMYALTFRGGFPSQPIPINSDTPPQTDEDSPFGVVPPSNRNGTALLRISKQIHRELSTQIHERRRIALWLHDSVTRQPHALAHFKSELDGFLAETSGAKIQHLDIGVFDRLPELAVELAAPKMTSHERIQRLRAHSVASEAAGFDRSKAAENRKRLLDAAERLSSVLTNVRSITLHDHYDHLITAAEGPVHYVERMAKFFPKLTELVLVEPAPTGQCQRFVFCEGRPLFGPRGPPLQPPVGIASRIRLKDALKKGLLERKIFFDPKLDEEE